MFASYSSSSVVLLDASCIHRYPVLEYLLGSLDLLLLEIQCVHQVVRDFINLGCHANAIVCRNRNDFSPQMPTRVRRDLVLKSDLVERIFQAASALSLLGSFQSR